jgi:hypothetical protein
MRREGEAGRGWIREKGKHEGTGGRRGGGGGGQTATHTARFIHSELKGRGAREECEELWWGSGRTPPCLHLEEGKERASENECVPFTCVYSHLRKTRVMFT